MELSDSLSSSDFGSASSQQGLLAVQGVVRFHSGRQKRLHPQQWELLTLGS